MVPGPCSSRENLRYLGFACDPESGSVGDCSIDGDLFEVNLSLNCVWSSAQDPTSIISSKICSEVIEWTRPGWFGT
jgi:hypothetical protein